MEVLYIDDDELLPATVSRVKLDIKRKISLVAVSSAECQNALLESRASSGEDKEKARGRAGAFNASSISHAGMVMESIYISKKH